MTPASAEVLAALSLATDLANGNPLETALRTCALATALARAAGASEREVAHAHDAALLRYLGCTAFAHEEAALLGDDIEAKRAFAPLELSRRMQTVRAAAKVGARAAARAVLRGPALVGELARASCEVAVQLADRLGLAPQVLAALADTFERWDGKGSPARKKGEQLPLAARVMHVAVCAEVHHRLGGAAAALAVVKERRGRQLDPRLAKVLAANAPELLASLGESSAWTPAVQARPPGLHGGREVSLEEQLTAFADFVDLKSVYALGHSRAVAQLAARAGAALRLPEPEGQLLFRAALVHDLGHASVPTNVWEKPGALSVSEWERVRLHPYYTERVLVRSPALAALAPVASAHHERLDGAGYHRGVRSEGLTPAARVLAAADEYQGRLEPRPHRERLSPAAAADALHAAARAGKLDRAAAEAVLSAAGHAPRAKPVGWPSGLTDREVDVLRELVRGATNKQIAATLGLSARTVQHHTGHIYGKLGITTRAAAALHAVQHGLV